MNSKRNNIWSRNDTVGVIENRNGKTQDEFAGTGIAFDEDEQERTDVEEQRPGRNRKRLFGAALFLFILVVAGASLWMMFGGAGKKIDLQVRDNTNKTEQAARDTESLTAQAIAEVRSATATPTPAVGASPATATGATDAARTIIVPTTPVTVPLEGVSGDVSSPPAEAIAGQQGGASSSHAGGATKPGRIVSARNPERSIRCAPVPIAISARQPLQERSLKQSEIRLPVAFKKAENSVTLPPFGAMFPVRTLGALYTLRSSLTRFELLRDMQGQGWQMRKGAVFVGQQQGSEYDRAYISLLGFIDPETKRFVKITGEVLGADGAPGLQGKRRQISGRWARALGRVGASAVSLGQAALSRGNSTTVVLPGSVAPELAPSFNVVSRREFVEAPAGTPAFVMITDLPKEAQRIDADPLAEGKRETITDEELAELLSSGSPEKIRAAMPRMSSELRRIAEAALKEQNR